MQKKYYIQVNFSDGNKHKWEVPSPSKQLFDDAIRLITLNGITVPNEISTTEPFPKVLAFHYTGNSIVSLQMLEE